jgi:hypothetical protein
MEDGYENVMKSVDWAAVKTADLRKVCIHECAHKAVAWHFGAPSQVTISFNPNGSIEDKFFAGQTQVHASLSESETRVMCLAGTVAEQVDLDRNVEALDLWDWIGSAIDLSDTDAAGAGDWDLADLEKCVALVKRLWPEIELAASRQIEIENIVMATEAPGSMNTAA